MGDEKEKSDKPKWVAPNCRVAEALRARVAACAPGGALGTEVAIAAEFGVSRMTARKAVEALVGEGLVERRAGVGLFVSGAKRKKRFRFVAGNFLWDSVIRVARGFSRTAEAAGVEVELRDAAGDAAKLAEELAALPDAGVTGAAVFSIHAPALSKRLTDLAARHFPLVVLDEAFAPKTLVTGVVSDNVLGGRLAAERFIHAGHRALAFIGDYAADTVRARWKGFSSFAAESGLKSVRVELKTDDRLGDWAHLVHAATRSLMRRHPQTTGIFCSCDAVARHVLRALEALGFAVPRDVSLIGFDDDPIAEWMTPALTTIRQDFTALGVTAAKALLAGAEGTLAGPRIVPVSLIMRDTLARARKSGRNSV